MARPETAPTLIVELFIKTGQDDTALGQAREHRQQIRRGGKAAGRAGGDHRPRGRAFAPCLGQAVEHRVAPRRTIERFVIGEDIRPMLDQDLEEIEHFLPMGGMALRRQLVEAGEIEPLAPGLVEKGAKLLGEAHGLIDMALRIARENEPGEEELAAERRQGRRQLAALRQSGGAGLVLVEIAERADARQQHGAGIRLPEKGLA